MIHIVLDLSENPVAPIFDFDRETSATTWFSTLQLFLVSVVYASIGSNTPTESPVSSRYFYLGSFTFFFLSVDEGAIVHERVTDLVEMSGFDFLLIDGQGGWIAIYLITFFILALVLYKTLLKASKAYTKEFYLSLTGVAIFLSGGVLLEIVGYLFLDADKQSTGYKIEVLFEEFLEMFGVTVMLYAALLLNRRIIGMNRQLPFSENR